MPLAEAQGARIYYEVEGEGEPLLLIPGFGSNATVYWANVPALAQRFRTIVLDPRGSGRSQVSADGYTMATFAADAVAVLDAAGERDAHVFGTSFGGMVAQNLALLHPERVRRLVLGCTTPGGAHHVMPPRETIEVFMAAGDIPDPAAAVRSTALMHYSDAYVARRGDEIVERALRNQELRASAAGRAGQSAAVQTHATHDRLHQVAAPTLVLHGEDDPLVPLVNGRAIAARIPDARMIVYPGARHVFFVECAEAVNTDVIAFLSESGEAAA